MSVVVKVLSLCILAIHTIQQPYVNNIYIDPQAINDTPKCHTSNSPLVPCKTLGYAFQYRNDSTQYVLHPDSIHQLTHEVAIFKNLRVLAIQGGGNGSTIMCNGNNIGLGFVNVSSISITNVTFLYCSATRNSTSRNFSVHVDSFLLYQFKVGIYFYLCTDVSMLHVEVSSGVNATGVVMYDTVGRNTIQNSIFKNNSVSEGQPGGGGVYVEFSFCVPGDNNCNDDTMKTSNVGASYSFDNCNFSNNAASNEGTEENSTYIVPYRSTHQAFGRGGGLSIFVKGRATENTFEITNCLFEGNVAQWGGGLFLEFHDETANNSVHVTNCTFIRNSCKYTLDSGTGGGGMRIGHYVYGYYYQQDVLNMTSNRIKLSSCNFYYNSAMYGGGLSISPSLEDTVLGMEAIVELIELEFVGNTGKIGAGLHVGKFPLITRGIMIKLMIRECSFSNNSARYADLLPDKSKYKPHPMGIGAVYINQVTAIFQGLNIFYNNLGTALAVVGSPVDFTESYAVFFRNKGYRGGAIALLGSTYILIDNNTRLDFVDNAATDKGGAIYNKYVEMDNLMTQPNCFIRHINPFLHPDHWQAVVFFSNNLDHNTLKNNSIHSSSVLPCAWSGGNGYTVDKGKLFCWNNWTYYDSNIALVHRCSAQVTSEAGEITSKLRNSTETFQVIPGKWRNLPLSIRDDYGNDLIKETVFSSTSNISGSINHYFWGGQANLSGGQKFLNGDHQYVKENLVSLGERIWNVPLNTELLPCAPGLKATKINDNEVVCECPETYLGLVSCDPNTLEVKLNDGSWMGRLEGSEKYVVGACPSGYCNITKSSFITLPNSSHELNQYVCSKNSCGIMCGECLHGYGPSVNSQAFYCVYCTDINLAANIAKYVAAIYLPLATLFTFLIVFDIRLTTGPANAFILFSQMVSSTFSLDADGQIPLNRLTGSVSSYMDLLSGYKLIYGVFNLEFIENLLSPFCFSSKLNVLTILMLDYGVAVFPLFMIFVAVVCLKIRECCSFPSRSHDLVRTNHRNSFSCLGSWNIKEALLPAFAAFILLSYTKFSLTSTYIMITQNLKDENGTKIEPARVYFAAQYHNDDPHYRYVYLLPSAFIFVIFVCLPPLLLLSYPLRAFEVCLSKVRFLRRFYPVDKVHFFLDTFQGCYKNNMRFFAGLYFLFRLTLKATYLFTDTWLQQFVVQQIACVIMVTLISICQPYNKANRIFNYVDALVFADLLVINALSLFLYAASLKGQQPPLSAFVFQYVLVFLPLLYMIVYILWYLASSRNKWLKKNLTFWKQFQFDNSQKRVHTKRKTINHTRSEVSVDDLHADDEDEALFARAGITNRYRKASEEVSVSDAHSYGSLDANGHNGTGETDRRLSSFPTRNSNSDKMRGSNGYGTMSSGHSQSSESNPRPEDS